MRFSHQSLVGDMQVALITSLGFMVFFFTDFLLKSRNFDRVSLSVVARAYKLLFCSLPFPLTVSL